MPRIWQHLGQRPRLVVGLAIALLVALSGVAGTLAMTLPVLRAGRAVVPTATSSPTPPVATPGYATPGPGTPWTDPLAAVRAAYLPVSLQVPDMELDAPVVPVGETKQGAMATPISSNASDPLWGEAYWWSGGVVPGETGNAVMAGHVNRSDGSAASFTDLHLLQVGDTLDVIAANGTALTFSVVAVEHVSSYANGPGDPTLSAIFGPSTTRDLNLITCAGEWDGTMYNQRLVVLTRLVGTPPPDLP